MFERKAKPPDGPNLLDRVVRSGAKRLAILGLHPLAGSRSVLAALLREVHSRSWPIALTSAPRIPLEQEESFESGPPVTRVAVPEGAVVATSCATAAAEGAARLERVEETPWRGSRGPVAIYRVAEGGQVDVEGPGEADEIRAAMTRLAEISGGMVLVDGGWERRAFAAPGTSDGTILVLGAGYSATPARAAAAARYVVETLSVPPCDEPARVAWEEIAKHGAAALLNGSGRSVGVLPPGLEDPVPAIRTPEGDPAATVVLPYGLNDEFMIPLVRSSLRCTLVVRDPTRLNVAPVYFKAWLKGRGRIQVVRPMRLLAIATNPSNPSGPDADPEAFRQTVAGAIPQLPVHDVVLDAGGVPRKPIWRFWE